MTSSNTIQKGLIIGGAVAVLLLVTSKKAVSAESADAMNNFYGKPAFLPTGPAGVRNNNPGNIVKSSATWLGKVPLSKNTSDRFEQFYNYTYGVRAMIVNLYGWYKKGNTTINKLIEIWAPRTENDTTAYQLFVQKEAALPRLVTFEFNKDNVQRIVKAMVKHENGGDYLTDDQFNKAWRLV